ncbi:hypothetical protein HDF22_000055 [Mucilaginibacter lappiensis]|uniref:Uncharacterized protein n=2 Tax=Mucilaginibacter lappiensis TaxID=354630 RepID=A0A841J586_9SPHI|nr:hypothetical protein [Mucilaginibacter lappiensis]MBB6107975.1 hypothetical protein [Mucilaginibacter lappiensis]MBB6125954.1 hypothetical protein [Mucilaginibacter lappiensis]
MLVAIIKVFIFLCILIIPLRGPKRRENKDDQSVQTKAISNYAVNEKGSLEMANKEYQSKTH